MLALRRSTVAVLLLAVFTLAAAAHAQIILAYGTFSPIRVSNLTTGAGSYWSNGFGGGITFTPVHLGPLSLALDLRGSKSPQTQHADTVLVGVKAGFKLPVIPLKPYLQGSGGYVGSRVAINSGQSEGQNFWAYEVLGGLDYTLIPHVDLRLIEIGGGQGISRSGPNANAPNVSILTINTGVVVYF